jgi:ATP-binding protein involved in chromosome partitioning
MTASVPVSIQRLEGVGLAIRWQDGAQGTIPARLLRTYCPCANCREARGEGNHERPLSAPVAESAPSKGNTKKRRSLAIVQNSIEEELDLREVWAVGNYAIGLRWADGHATGIYPFKLLRELSIRDQ